MSFRGQILLKPSMVRKHFNYNEKVMTNVNNNTKRGGNSPFFVNGFFHVSKGDFSFCGYFHLLLLLFKCVGI